MPKYAIYTSEDNGPWQHEMDFEGTASEASEEAQGWKSGGRKKVKMVSLNPAQWVSKNRDYSTIISGNTESLIRSYVESLLLKKESSLHIFNPSDEGDEEITADSLEYYKKAFGSLPRDVVVVDGSNANSSDAAKINSIVSKLTKTLSGGRGSTVKAGTVNGADVVAVIDYGATYLYLDYSGLSKLNLS